MQDNPDQMICSERREGENIGTLEDVKKEKKEKRKKEKKVSENKNDERDREKKKNYK